VALRTCRTCGEQFLPYPGKPGFVDECLACTNERGGDVPKKIAEEGENWKPVSPDIYKRYPKRKGPAFRSFNTNS
jgi:hypothetical protein